ncbi:MAG TPA: hypothetical protein VIW70_01355 [Rubrivivax sp.]
MTDPKDNESFFRKVVRFVANPATDWTDLTSRQDDGRDLDLEKSELKAMVERKRRNDFVRKREFDMLRKVRREGLTPEQLAALGTSGRLDDSEARVSEGTARQESGVKAKIDHIEREMVGDGSLKATTRSPAFFDAATVPAVLARAGSPSTRSGALNRPAVAPLDPGPDDDERLPALPPLLDLDAAELAPSTAAPASAPVTMSGGLGPLTPVNFGNGEPSGDPGKAPAVEVAVEVSEIVHDPELDEAVIAFANADFDQCERSLQQLIAPVGPRALHAETWLALFDLYRATGQHERFESLALDYARQFGWSAPQWYSLPKLVADAAAEDRPTPARVIGDVGWICPDELDVEAVARLRSQTLQMPLPWVFDWSGLNRVDAEAAMHLSGLFRVWSGQPLDMQWMGGERLFTVLSEAAPSGVRDADPAFWLTRLDALRLVNRVDQFDETAIDYCVTYEVSPPSWEPTRCKVHVSGSGLSTRTPPLSVVSEVSTSFMDTGIADDHAAIQVTRLELSGQLIGDISSTLQRLNGELGESTVVSVSCARLIRVDFIAAGDLLNWVLSTRNDKHLVHFVDAHRLVALFFCAMGINEHARVQVRKV